MSKLKQYEIDALVSIIRRQVTEETKAKNKASDNTRHMTPSKSHVRNMTKWFKIRQKANVENIINSSYNVSK